MWICKLIGHKMTHVIYKGLFNLGEGVRVYCERCGQGPDAKPAVDPAEPGTPVEEGADNDN